MVLLPVAVPSDATHMSKKAPPVKYKKAPQAPRRFKSSYMFFSIAKHKEIRNQLEEKGEADKPSTTEVAKMVSQAWKDMSHEEREIYEDMARRDKARYEVEKTMYAGPWKIPAKRRSQKDPNAPKRPMSAFLSFSNAKRNQVKEENPNIGNAEISRILAQMWKDASEEERKEHIDKEFTLRREYKVAIAEWRKESEFELQAARKEREDEAMKTAMTGSTQHQRDQDKSSTNDGRWNQYTYPYHEASYHQPPHHSAYGGYHHHNQVPPYMPYGGSSSVPPPPSSHLNHPDSQPYYPAPAPPAPKQHHPPSGGALPEPTPPPPHQPYSVDPAAGQHYYYSSHPSSSSAHYYYQQQYGGQTQPPYDDGGGSDATRSPHYPAPPHDTNYSYNRSHYEGTSQDTDNGEYDQANYGASHYYPPQQNHDNYGHHQGYDYHGSYHHSTSDGARERENRDGADPNYHHSGQSSSYYQTNNSSYYGGY